MPVHNNPPALMKMSEIVAEFKGAPQHSLKEYYAGAATGYVPAGTTGQGGHKIPSAGVIKYSDFYGAAKATIKSYVGSGFYEYVKVGTKWVISETGITTYLAGFGQGHDDAGKAIHVLGNINPSPTWTDVQSGAALTNFHVGMLSGRPIRYVVQFTLLMDPSNPLWGVKPTSIKLTNTNPKYGGGTLIIPINDPAINFTMNANVKGNRMTAQKIAAITGAPSSILNTYVGSESFRMYGIARALDLPSIHWSQTILSTQAGNSAMPWALELQW